MGNPSYFHMAQSDEKNEPLVSVVVITYNSAKTVGETLDSIKAQTYQNLELIVSDDCSKDNTLEIVSAWLKENEQSFKSVAMLTSDMNKGVAANINKGICASKGEWVKSIAGDDLLTNDAICEYVSFVLNHPDCRICLAMLDVFGAPKDVLDKRNFHLNDIYSELKSHDRLGLYSIALVKHILPGPGIFYQKSLWEEIGGFDEDYSMAEEWPFELRVLSVTSVMLLEKKIVRWRQSLGSLSNNKESMNYIQDRLIYKNIRRKRLMADFRFFDVMECDLQYKYKATGKWYYKGLRFLLPHLVVRRLIRLINIKLNNLL